MSNERGPEYNKSSALEREFSPENFMAYAQACEEIAIKLEEILREPKGNVAILLPSRGALPLFNGAVLALRHLDMAGRIQLPPLRCFDFVREKITPSGEKKFQVLIFPFTADVNFGSLSNPSETRKIIDGMRRFGAKTVLEFLKPPEKRNGEEYKLFQVFLAVVEKRRDMVDFYNQFPRVDRFVVIDTVISGRASWTILDEWERNEIKIGQLECGAKIEPILVIDANGKKIKEDFRRYIDRCQNCFRIPRIFTEDRGATLEGVVAVIYPDLILEAHQNLYPQGYPLFGSWHNVPLQRREVYYGIFDAFLQALESTMEMKKGYENDRISFCQKLRDSGVLRGGEEIGGRQLNPFWEIEEVEETSAHVVQIRYGARVVSNIIREISKEMRNF